MPSKTTVIAQRIEPYLDGELARIGAQWAALVEPPPGPRPLPHVPNLAVRKWNDDVVEGYLQGGEAGGRRLVRDNLGWMLERPWATCYQLENERGCNSNEEIARYAAFLLGQMYEADQVGVKVMVWNVPEGNPHDNGTNDPSVTRWKVQQFAGVVREAIRRGHYLGPHAYWRPNVEGPLGKYHALGRIAQDVAWWREAGVNVDGLRLIVGETGIDGGIAGYPAREGWRILSNLEDYTAQAAEAEQYARGLPWLEALCHFVAGYENPWASFHLDQPALRRMGDKVLALGPAAPTAPGEGNMDEVIQAIRHAARNARGIAYNPDAALTKYAISKGLGEPLTDELRVTVGGVVYAAQAFPLGIAYCREGDWGRIQHA